MNISEILTGIKNWVLEKIQMDELTDNDINEIFLGDLTYTTLYTEDFLEEGGGYTPDIWAEELGYNDWEQMAAIIIQNPDENLSVFGSQRFRNTGETIQYEGQNYQLWHMEAGDGTGDDWEDTGLDALLRNDLDDSVINANMIVNDKSKRFVPFVAIADTDGEIYAPMPLDDTYSLLYATHETD